VSSEHFTVDGTLLKAWASHKSFKPKGGPPSQPPVGRNAEVGFHGERRSNDTHASTTDPESRLYRKSNNTAATLCFAGHLLMENRNALIIDAELGFADGYAERATATEMLARLPKTARRRTVAGDKGYDTKGFVAGVRKLGFTPHVAPNTRYSAIDGRTTRHPGHAVSMRIRKRVEEPFGWIKTIAGGRQLRYRGRARNRAWFKITTAVYNILRITALDLQHA
jgi:Transposase DDE domain